MTETHGYYVHIKRYDEKGEVELEMLSSFSTLDSFEEWKRATADLGGIVTEVTKEEFERLERLFDQEEV